MTEALSQSGLTLPTFNQLSIASIDRVAERVQHHRA